MYCEYKLNKIKILNAVSVYSWKMKEVSETTKVDLKRQSEIFKLHQNQFALFAYIISSVLLMVFKKL